MSPELPAPAQPRVVRDAGFTLPELLIAMLISGILIVSISMAFSTVLQTQASATARLAESKDITFVQTWLPVDLSSALDTFDTPSDAELRTQMAALTPSMSFLATLPGTNVLTVVRPDLELGSGVYYIVSYRYEQVNGEWQISRYEIRNPGTGSEVVKMVGVAHEIPAPPPGWDPTKSPTHAVEVTSRNQVILRPIGEDVTVNFESGNEFVSGGAGLSAENQLPADYTGGLTNPSAPPSRCGGRVAIVIDTSGSVPQSNGGIPTETAAVGFIDGFTGTPTTLSINGFDREAYGMNTIAPVASNGVRAPFFSLLNNGPEVAAMKKRITDLDNRDGAWNEGNPDSPTADGIHWDQIGAGTNWEDGIWNVFRRTDGSYYGLDQPDLVVFITDGEPTMVRTTTGGNTSATNSAAATAAKVQADLGRKAGARVIGVMVGNKSTNTTYVNYLKSVVGNLEWNGSVNGDGTVNVGNAATADLFKGGFDKLGGILRSIMIAECGGTLTLQKRIDTGSGLENPSSGVWSYSTELGNRELDRAVTSSITFDYSFGAGVTQKTVSVIEHPGGGYVWDRAECTANGVVIPSSPNPPDPVTGVIPPGVTVTVAADQAVSCLMISRP